MKKTLVSAVIAVLILIVLASLAFAARFAAPAATPFKGTLEGSETNAPGIRGQTFVATGDAAGTAAQLGSYTLHYQIEVNATTRASTNGVATFIAATGDKIYAKGNGQGGPSGTPGIGAPVEHYTITGGTGRFAGASGSYEVHRLIQQQTGVTWGSFNGTITLSQER